MLDQLEGRLNKSLKRDYALHTKKAVEKSL